MKDYINQILKIHIKLCPPELMKLSHNYRRVKKNTNAVLDELKNKICKKTC